jgi:hypothetical protein
MERYELGRQDRGRLAEVLAAGLHKHPPECLETLVEEHTRECYRSLIRTRVRVSKADITRYRWTDELPVPVPDDISWRPDFFLTTEWGVESRRDEVAEEHHPLLDWVEERPEALLSIYYPVEVKSGNKKTLTAQQSTAIPRVSETVDCVHPIILRIDIGDLPESYAMDAELFSETDESGGETTRYQF